MKIKFYKNILEYSKEKNICRQTASKEIKEGKTNLIKIPKGYKFAKIIED